VLDELLFLQAKFVIFFISIIDGAYGILALGQLLRGHLQENMFRFIGLSQPAGQLDTQGFFNNLPQGWIGYQVFLPQEVQLFAGDGP